ncbi:N,N-dimethylaniline monooxygenase [Aureococcus anophagefferens]|uniref:N,N-dimethylaniline monooxygenase n=1 Tax=Aureococcus anophagefferens TaxID=44056 RepID=A0ABR1FK91_AURAN
MAAVSSADLLYDPQVWVYFAILGWSLRGQVQRATRRGLAAACALVGITWFYIFRFTLAYKNGGGANLFDDAYADVLRGPHARSSCQLLTWVAVAFRARASRGVLWTGMLGAMSAAYSLSPPDLAPPPRVATLDAACALAKPRLRRRCRGSSTRRAAFGAVLKALHALLVLPRYAPALPGSVDATVFYGAVAALAGARARQGAPPATAGRRVFADATRARMVSSKYVTAFSDFRLGRGAESHLALDAYVAYLERYADRFGLARKIEFGTTVRAVARAGGRYAVETEAGGVARTRSFDRVAAPGSTRTEDAGAARPPQAATSSTAGTTRPRAASRGGASSSSARARRPSTSPTAPRPRARAVTMSTLARLRVSVPASFGEGVAPLDCIIANAGTHCWESAWARRVGLHWWITTKFQRLGMLVLGGSSKGWNQWRRASSVAVGVDLLDKYEPVKFESDGVAFRSLDGGPDRVVGADVVVFATGYRQKFPFLFGRRAGDDRCPAATSSPAGAAKDRFLRSSASAQDLVKSKEPVQLDDISHGQESLDLVKSKEPVQLDDISHGQESLVALSGDSSSSDVEAAASLKGRFLRSSASAQDLVKSKEPVQLDDISHGQESLVALSGDSPDLVKSKEPVQLDDISHGQESLAANSGDSPSSDAEAAASLKGRFLRSSASAQDLLAAKEPAQLDDISHGQESLVALSGDSPSSDAEAAASLKGRFLRSSASAQDLLAAKEPAQLDKVAHAQESLFAASVAGGDSSSSEVEATASLAPEADVRRLSVSKEPAQFDDGLFGKTRLPLAARNGVVRDWATGAEVRTPCPDTSGSRKVS